MSDSETKEKKWKKFLKFRKLFYLIPFLDFVIVAGSLAFGKVHERSDFDVIIGARQKRIFTVRFFCYVVFSFFRIWRKSDESKEKSSDKICFNHFVTPNSYKLKPPHNLYWQKLYQNLEPVYGDTHKVELFFIKNRDWCEREQIFLNRERWEEKRPNLIRKILEAILSGFLGSIFEALVKKFQLERINKNLNRDIGYKPRLCFNDEELEFHPDTQRIDEFIQKGSF